MDCATATPTEAGRLGDAAHRRLGRTIKCIIMLNDYKNHVYNPFMPGIITLSFELRRKEEANRDTMQHTEGGGGGGVTAAAALCGPRSCS